MILDLRGVSEMPVLGHGRVLLRLTAVSDLLSVILIRLPSTAGFCRPYFELRGTRFVWRAIAA